MMAFEGRFSIGLGNQQELEMFTAAYARYSSKTVLTLRNLNAESENKGWQKTIGRITLNAEALRTLADMMELASKTQPRKTPNRSKMQYHTIWIRKDETDPVDENEENEEMLMGLDIMAPESQWGVNLQIRDCTGAEETVCEVEMTPEKAEEVIDTARKMAAAYEAQEREQERLCRLRMLKAQYLSADRTK